MTASRPHVTMACLAVSVPMGQQSYESHLLAELLELGTRARAVHIRALRSTLDGDRRLPLSRLGRAPLRLQHVAGAYAYGPGLVHRTDLRLPAAPLEVVTVHDLAPLHYPEEGSLPPTAKAQLIKAAAVITGTRAAASEIESVFGIADVHVIPHGVEPSFFAAPPLSADDRAHLALPERWILHTGGASRRKNLALLAEAWPTVHRQFPDVGLVLCGPPHPDRDRLFAQQPGCHLLGLLDADVLRSLLSESAAAVIPSAYEGFGLPALEAMAARVPVVAANSAAVAEVCGDAGIVVAMTAPALTQGLITALTGVGPVLLDRGLARAKRHTWRASAMAHLDVYAEARQRSGVA